MENLSQGFPQKSLAPKSTHHVPSFQLSPSLGQIEASLLSTNKSSPQRLKVHLISDFQWDQYRFYAGAFRDIEWEFHPLADPEAEVNLSLVSPQLQTKGLLQLQLQVELLGQYPVGNAVELEVFQADQLLSQQKIRWEGIPQTLQILLPPSAQRLKPFDVKLKAPLDSNLSGNYVYIQWNSKKTPWIGILTSEGWQGMYERGLHQLKAALIANQMESFLMTTRGELERLQPDLVILLGDHPARWQTDLPTKTEALFIPTRLEDWSDLTVAPEARFAELPKEQIQLDWRQAPFASDWGIDAVGPVLFRSNNPAMWLLGTGVSPQWGPLYQAASFVETLRQWVKIPLDHQLIQLLGTFEVDDPALTEVIGSPVAFYPGHYSENSFSGTTSSQFAVNVSSRELGSRWMTSQEIQEMQDYFKKKRKESFSEEQGSSINQIRRMLLWTILALMFFELVVVMLTHFWNHRKRHSAE